MLNKIGTMKKAPILKRLLSMCLVVILAIISIRCDDDPEYLTRSEVVTQENPTTTATVIPSGIPTKMYYQMNMKLGHDASECTGCVMINGTATHVPCRGPGDKCTVQSVTAVTPFETHISLIPGQPANLYTVTSLPSHILDSLGLYDEFRYDNFFLFPDRSFWVSGTFTSWNARWINIPEQFIKRNNDDSLLYFERVSFSATPLFDNQ